MRQINIRQAVARDIAGSHAAAGKGAVFQAGILALCGPCEVWSTVPGRSRKRGPSAAAGVTGRQSNAERERERTRLRIMVEGTREFMNRDQDTARDGNYAVDEAPDALVANSSPVTA